MPPNTYDQVPYLNRAHTHTHPDRLAALATLLGLEPPCLERCRVLELGCANGRNLLPMALALPAAHFTGVDLSARQIADGQAAVAELGLSNLDLRHASLAGVDAGYGLFDYIICHGVYSWVDEALQDAATIHRLSRLLSNHPLLIAQLVAYAHLAMAAGADAAIVQSGLLSTDQVRRQRELIRLQRGQLRFQQIQHRR